MSSTDTNDDDEEFETAFVEVIAFIILVASVLIGYCYDSLPIFHKIEVFCPHSSANMLFGILVGAIVSAFHDLNEVFSFDPELFFTFVLPPIIFSAGYSLPKDFFFHNFGSIMMFSFVGTIISAFFVGGLVFAWAEPNLNLDFTKSMMLGSLISAVDPVAVILVLRTLNVDEQLKIILFGESVLNDAAAVVINRVFVSIETEERSTESALSFAIIEIAGIAIGSILIGVICALAVARIHKVSKLSLPDHPRATEMACFTLGAFLPYAVAESLSLSGIMSVLFAGIIADFYTSHHLNRETESASRNMIQTLSYLGESFIFIYLGMSFFPASNHVFHGGLIGLTLVLGFVGRALAVFPLAIILNFGRKYKIPFKHQCVIWYAGLRGPVAFALAVATPVDPKFPKVDNVIISTTLFVVAFTTLVLGGAAYPFLKILNVGVMESTTRFRSAGYDLSNHWFSKVDARFLKPWFGPENKRRQNTPPTILGMTSVDVDVDAEQEDNNNNNNGQNDRTPKVEMIDVDNTGKSSPETTDQNTTAGDE